MNHQPRTITRSNPAELVIEWQDDHVTRYSTRELRSLCPCAGCVDELTGVRTHDPATVASDLLHQDVRLVGNYALSILFGGAFMVLADLAARTLVSPAELPIGVVTAFLGAPFFVVVLRTSRREVW